ASRDRSDARVWWLPIDMHCAGAALREAAAEMRIVETEIVAQSIKQRHLRIGVNRMRLAVDIEGEALGHGVQLPEQIKEAGGLRPTAPWRLVPTLAHQKLASHSGFGNALRG